MIEPIEFRFRRLRRTNSLRELVRESQQKEIGISCMAFLGQHAGKLWDQQQQLKQNKEHAALFERIYSLLHPEDNKEHAAASGLGLDRFFDCYHPSLFKISILDALLDISRIS